MPAVPSGSSPESSAPVDDRTRFLLEFARALQTYGAAAHRLEHALESCARHLGIEGQFFVTPTSVFCGFGAPGRQHVHLLRIDAGGVDLRRLVELYEVWGAVLANRLSARDAAGRVRGIVDTPPEPRGVVWVASHALASATAACFLGGRLPEIALALVLGLGVGLGVRLRPRLDRVAEPLAAFVCAFVVTLASARVPLAHEPTVIAGVIALVPGFSLTIAMSELAYGHLAAGTARLMGAGITFLTLTVGVVLGTRVAHSLVTPLPPPEVVPPPLLWLVAAVTLAAWCFSVLFRGRGRDLVYVVLACAVAVLGARLGVRLLGPELGMFVGALAMGSLSNLLARARGTPAAVTAAPGLMVLVPGSLGLLSLASLAERQTVAGVQSAFTVLMVACALVTGLLAANALVPTRREL